MADKRLDAGLYLVSTPIGSARDITLRALDVLRDADVLAAEDTRTLRHLMEIHGIPLGGRRIVAYHDHNAKRQRPGLIERMKDGASVAYASDAGTPLVADPGFALAQDAIGAGLKVVPVPGASAVLPALQLSGLPTDRFCFVGFPPPQSTARRRFFEELKGVPATLVVFEAPRRCLRTVKDIAAVMGGDRRAALCRELTKKFESARRGSLSEIAESCAADPPKGEIVLLVDRAAAVADEAQVNAALKEALKTMTVKDAAGSVAAAFGVSKRELYQRALNWGRTT